MMMQQMMMQQQVTAGSKKARELYVGNLAIGLVTDQMLRDFFNTALKGLAPDQAGMDAVTNIWMAADMKYSFVEFRTEDLATTACSLDKVELCGRSLNIGRPSGYQPGTGGGGSAVIPNPMAAMMGGAAAANPMAAIAGMAGMAANPMLAGMMGQMGMLGGLNAAQMLGGAAAAPGVPSTKVLKLENMLKVEELDGDDYDEIVEEVRDECAKKGAVTAISVPKPSSDGSKVAGLGNVFVKFAEVTSAEACFKLMSGRTFDGNKIKASYLAEADFDAKNFS